MKKFISLLVLFALSSTAHGSTNTDNTHTQGSGASDKKIIFNRGAGTSNPVIKWNQSLQKLQFTNDGTNYFSFGVVLETLSAISGTSIDWAVSDFFTKTLSANTTFTFSNTGARRVIIVRLTNTASNYTVTWPTVKWSGGTPPTMTTGAKIDVYTFVYDGTNIIGSAVQNAF